MLLLSVQSEAIEKLLNQEMIMAIIFSIFSDKQENIEIGKLEKLKSFVLENEIDEIYFERGF
jgi:hypothetical protein